MLHPKTIRLSYINDSIGSLKKDCEAKKNIQRSHLETIASFFVNFRPWKLGNGNMTLQVNSTTWASIYERLIETSKKAIRPKAFEKKLQKFRKASRIALFNPLRIKFFQFSLKVSRAVRANWMPS